MKKISAWLLVLPFTLVLSSCSASTPHQNFKRHMSGNVGKTIDGSTTLWVKPDRYVASRQLRNGNIENEYKLRGTCRYFFEHNPETGIIVNWRFEGSELDCVIVP